MALGCPKCRHSAGGCGTCRVKAAGEAPKPKAPARSGGGGGGGGGGKNGPPADWEPPSEGDTIEVEIADDAGATSWIKAKVAAVKADGSFSAKITTHDDEWDDWFTWSEEGTDWRRKSRRSSRGGSRSSSDSTPSTKLRLRVDHRRREAVLLPPLESKRLSNRPTRGQKAIRFDVPEGTLPYVSVDESLVGQRVRCLTPELRWAKGSLVSSRGNGRFVVRYDKVKKQAEREEEITLLDHRVELLVDVTPFPPLDEDDVEECFIEEEEPPEPAARKKPRAERRDGETSGATGDGGGTSTDEAAPAAEGGAPADASAEGVVDGAKEEDAMEVVDPEGEEGADTPAPCGRDGMSIVQAVDESSEMRRSSRRGAPSESTPASALEPAAETKPIKPDPADEAGGKKKQMRLFTSKLAASGFRHVRAVPYGSGLTEWVEPTAVDEGVTLVYVAQFWSAGKQQTLGPVDTAMEAAAAYTRFVIAEFEEEEAAAAATEAKAAARAAAKATAAEAAAAHAATARAAEEAAAEAAAEAQGMRLTRGLRGPATSGGPSLTEAERAERAEREKVERAALAERLEQADRAAYFAANQKKKSDGYDDELVGRRVRATRESDGEPSVGTIFERAVGAKRSAAGNYKVRYDDGVIEDLTLPDEGVELQPKDYGDFDESSGGSLEEARKAWKAEVAEDELRAKEDQALEGLTLHTSSKSETGYRCVTSQYLSRLAVFAYDVRATKDGRCVHVGRFKSKVQAAVAFARFISSEPASTTFGNMVIEPVLPESTKEEGINTVDKILDVRVTVVDCLEPSDFLENGLPLMSGTDEEWGKARRTKEAVAALAAGYSIEQALRIPRRTKASVAGAAAGVPQESPVASLGAPALVVLTATVGAQAAGSADADMADAAQDGDAAVEGAMEVDERDATAAESAADSAGTGGGQAEAIASRAKRRGTPELGEIVQVEIDEEGVINWVDAEVRQVMPSNRFYVCVGNDEDFIESYGVEEEFKEWRRTGRLNDISEREITKVEVREMLVKLRGYSYLRSKWMTVPEIEADGGLTVNILKKFEKRLEKGESDESYKKHLGIERIVSHRHRRGALEYLVKPVGLSYADCSWERAPQLTDPDALESIRRYLAASGHTPASLQGTDMHGAGTAWLKAGSQLEIAGKSRHGGEWTTAKVLQAGDTDVLIERKNEIPPPDTGKTAQLEQQGAGTSAGQQGEEVEAEQQGEDASAEQQGTKAGAEEQGEEAEAEQQCMDVEAEQGAGASSDKRDANDGSPSTEDPQKEAEAVVSAVPQVQATVRERLPLSRMRPLPPRTPKDFRPVNEQAVQVSHSTGWWAGVVKSVRKKGEQLLDDDKFFAMRRELATKRAAMQASLQPPQSAEDLPAGRRASGRDGRQWEVVVADDDGAFHRWAPVRGVGKGGAGGSKRRRCGVCAGCLAENCGACKYCLDMPKFGGRGVMRQTCEKRACLSLKFDDDGDQFRRDDAKVTSRATARKAAKDEDTSGRRSSRQPVPVAKLQPPDGGEPNALVKGLHPRRAVVGKRLVVDYEEEDESGAPINVRYPATVLAYSVIDGLLVRFDGSPDDDPTWVDEAGDDDWEWEDKIKVEQPSRSERQRDANAADKSEPTRRSGRRSASTQQEEVEHVAETAEPPPTTSGPDARPPPPPAGWQWPYEGERLEVETELEDGSTTWVPATVKTLLVDSNFQCVVHQTETEGGKFDDWFTWKEEGKDWRRPKLEDASSRPPSQAGGALAPAKSSDGLIRGKRRNKITGARIVVDYEEKGDDGKPEIKRYPGVVLAYSSEHGLLVRFDGYDDDDEEGEAWVEEAGVDDWDWEESATDVAKELTCLVVDAEGTEFWKPLKALRPNWVWWSAEEGWSIDDDEPWQKMYDVEVEAADEQEEDDDLLTTAEREAKAAALLRGETGEEEDAEPTSDESGAAQGMDVEASKPNDDVDGGEEETQEEGGLRKPRHARDDDYNEDGEEAQDDEESEEDEPTEVTGWTKLEESPDFLCNGMKLRSYQLDGLNWMRLSYYLGRNIILGDEMGLGKTAQSVSMLQSLRSIEGVQGPFMIVAPLSTLPHWERELSQWTDMYWVNFHGTADARRVVQQYEWLVDEKAPRGQEKYRFHVLLANYETVVQEPDALIAVKWQYLIVDEGHRLKNRNSRCLEVMNLLRCKRKLVLSGTPLQNHVAELWSMLHFLEQEKFTGSLCVEAFLEKFGSLSTGGGTAKQVAQLNKLIRPHLLRREKEDVEQSLPGMKETLLYVEITNLQKMCYRAVLERNRELLLRGAGTAGTGPSFNNISMMLRHCCNHPWLISDVEEGALLDLDQLYGGASEAERSARYTERLIQSSGKFVLLQKLLPKLRSEGHRVLFFSQFTKVLDLFEDLLESEGWGFERLDGSVSGVARQQAIDRFSDPESDCFVFMLSTRAGGVGINLTAADRVIVFDPDWNPQNDVQAMARCHRIGQTKAVQVYKLCTKGTYENHMLKLANQKLGLEHAIMRTGEHSERALTSTGFAKSDKGPFDAATATQRASQIEQLLKSGAQLLMSTEQDQDAVAFGESSIEDILQNYVETINDGGEGDGAGAGSSKDVVRSRSAFSQATVVSEQGSTIRMDDPDFWTKMLPGDGEAEAADAAAKRSGADRIKGLKFSDFGDNDLKESGPGRRKSSLGAQRAGEADGGPDAKQRKPRAPPFTRTELEAVRDRILAVGHAAAPEIDGDGGGELTGEQLLAQRCLAARDVRDVRKACDYVLVATLLRAPAELTAQWSPIELHTVGERAIRNMGDEVRPKFGGRQPKRDPQFQVAQRTLVTKAGGEPRPKGRAPHTDKGEPLTWSYERAKWVDCSKGGKSTVKGVPQKAGEREEVLAENARFEERMREVEQKMLDEWKEQQQDLAPPPEAEAEAAAEATATAPVGADAEVEMADADADVDAAQGEEGAAGDPAARTRRALEQLEAKLRPAKDAADWLAAEAKKNAGRWLERLLQHRKADDEAEIKKAARARVAGQKRAREEPEADGSREEEEEEEGRKRAREAESD